jgi:hypothetical protein
MTVTPLLVALLLSVPAFGLGVTVDGRVEYQQWIGCGSHLNGSAGHTPALRDLYASNEFRSAYRDAGFNAFRYEMFGELALVHPTGNRETAVRLDGSVAQNAALFDMSEPHIAVVGSFGNWLKTNPLPGEDATRVHLHAYTHSPPHWMKASNGHSGSFVGYSSCCGGVCLQQGVSKAFPWLTSWCSDPPTGESIGGALKQTTDNRDQFARWLAAYSDANQQAYGFPFDSISLQNESSFNSPFKSCSYRHCIDTGSGACWHYWADTMKAVKDYWGQVGLTIPVVGPGVGSIGRQACYGDGGNRLWEVMEFWDKAEHHSDPGLLAWIGGAQNNHYSGVGVEGVQLWDMLINGHQVAPDFNWKGTGPCDSNNPCPCSVPLELIDGVGTSKPVYGTEDGSTTHRWVDAGGAPASNSAITATLRLHNLATFGRLSAHMEWEFTNIDSDDQWTGDVLDHARVSNPLSDDKYVAYKHWCRYIRSGATRIKSTFDATGQPGYGGANKWDTFHSVNISAWANAQDRDLTLVIINMRSSSYPLEIKLQHTDSSGAFDWYLSTPAARWQVQQHPSWNPKTKTLSLTVPAYSVSTLVDGET